MSAHCVGKGATEEVYAAPEVSKIRKGVKYIRHSASEKVVFNINLPEMTPYATDSIRQSAIDLVVAQVEILQLEGPNL